jgi:hypothetical protein
MIPQPRWISDAGAWLAVGAVLDGDPDDKVRRWIPTG